MQGGQSGPEVLASPSHDANHSAQLIAAPALLDPSGGRPSTMQDEDNVPFAFATPDHEIIPLAKVDILPPHPVPEPELEVAPTETPASKAKRRQLYCAVGIVALVIVAAISVTVVRKVRDSRLDSRVWNALDPVLPDGSKEAIRKKGTPQSRAFHWVRGSAALKNRYPHQIRQMYALATLYYATNGPQWFDYYQIWLTDSERWGWEYEYGTYGVECIWSEGCIYPDGEVLRLHLVQYNLAGSIPPDIGILSALEELHLGGNALTGSIPTTIGWLTNLWYMTLNETGLTGPLPSSIGQLTNLEALDLSQNELLTGTFPSFMVQLTSLVSLAINNTAITGSTPSEICDFVNLTVISVDCNNVVCDCDQCECN